MTEQRGSDEVEGHGKRFLEDPEETGTTETSEDDVEGHRRLAQDADAAGDDVEGHLIRGVSQEDGSADPDDVEGHARYH